MKLFSKIRAAFDLAISPWKRSAAMQAIDYGWRDGGKIILLAHVGDRDYVKIINMKARLTIQEYAQMSKRLEAEFEASPAFIDAYIPRKDWPTFF